MTRLPESDKSINKPDALEAFVAIASGPELVAAYELLPRASVVWPVNTVTCRALLRLTRQLLILGRYHEAKESAQSASQIATVLHDESLIAEAQSLIGRAYSEQGELKQASLAYMDALAASRRCGDYRRYCIVLLWLSYLEQTKGHLSSAIEHASEAVKESMKRGFDREVAIGLQHLGLYYTLAGKFRLAIDTLLAAESEGSTNKNPFDYSCILLGLAFANLATGNFQKAHIDLNRAKACVEAVKSLRNLAICYEYEAALKLRQGKLDEAEKAIRECLRISLEEFPDGDMTSQGYRIWAEIDIKREDYPAAEERAMSALGVARRVGERIEIGAIERILGQCAGHRADLEATQRHFSETIAILSDCGARYELALSYLAAGQCALMERRLQLSYLHTALSLFQEMEVEGLAQEAEDAIRHLTSPLRLTDSKDSGGLTVLTRNRVMRNVLSGIDRVKNLDDIILLEGETGVGKDLLAKYAHFTGNRGDRPFVLFNAAAVPEALAESELFGHARGAFSGAVREREGLLFAAKNGTFFFNEISEAPPSFQAKLLSVIETRRVRPIGSNQERSIEARLIFATNRNLEEEIARGEFRKDLFYRLASARFVIPPLRERKGDIELLLSAFLKRQGVPESQLKALTNSKGWSACTHLRWDGNVRELEMFSRRVVLETSHGNGDPGALFERLIQELQSSNLTVRRPVDEARITAALKRHGGNKRRAAAELGIPESTLRWKLKSVGPDRDP